MKSFCLITPVGTVPPHLAAAKLMKGGGETKKTQGKLCELDLQNKCIQSDKPA